MRFDEGSTYEQWSNDMATDVDVVTLPIEEHSAMQEEIERLREALKPFATIDLLECRLPPEFAMHVLRARGVLTPNPSLSGPLRWRDVAEELPQEAQEVLFVRGGKTLHGAWIGGIFWHSNQKMAAAYWMPLPLPPNAKLTGGGANE